MRVARDENGEKEKEGEWREERKKERNYVTRGDTFFFLPRFARHPSVALQCTYIFLYLASFGNLLTQKNSPVFDL